MKIKIQYILLLAVSFTAVQLSAQKKDENIGTEVVNVVKPYTPTISDAFKVKETPAADDEDNTKKEPIKYSIFSFPVASTFAPSKGKAANVDKTAQERLYKNYVTGGIGSYLDIFGELYVTENIGDNDYVAGTVKHLSAFTNVKGIEVDSKFLNTGIDLTYGSQREKFSWNADMGYQVQKYFWYGLPEDFGATLTPVVREDIIEDINKVQTYHDFYVGGKIKFNESAFTDMTVKYNAFWDAYGSKEGRFIAKPKLAFDFLEKRVTTEITVDHVGGSFDKDYTGTNAFKYGVTKLGVSPSFGMKKDDWSFNIGAGLYYAMDSENNEGELFFYPRANATLKVVGDLMQFYLGIDGDLEQNSYRDFTNENPYVSPTLIVAPTDKQYDVYAGLKGKLSNYVSYDVRGSLTNEKNKAMFIANNYSEAQGQERYQYGNSFGVTYDLVRTMKLFGELKADFSKNVSLRMNGTLNKYTLEDQKEAWNLPEVTLNANLDVAITPKWYAGANVFFVGDRKDYQTNLDILPLVPPTDNTKTVKSYFDANAHVGYKYTDRFTAFLRLNNLANQNYERWLNYPVQSCEMILGANYKFDF